MVIVELCLSPGVGGLELYALKVIRHYQGMKQQSEHTCLPIVREGSFLDRKLESENIDRKHLRVISEYLPFFAALKLARIFDDSKVDIVHIHWRADLPLAAFAVKFSRRKVRLVYTRQMALTRAKFDFYHRFLYRQVDLYLTITRQLQDDARRFLPLDKDKVQLLYYGVPSPTQTEPEQCNEFFSSAGLTRGKFTVGLFGRIEHGKGQHLLLEAVHQLTSRGLDIQAMLIGHIMDQSYFDNLMKTAKQYSIDNRFKYYGFHNNPTAVMTCFDVVVLATKSETFGLVLPEAMRTGTAVIGSNAGGVPEIILHEETGLLFEPENSSDLSDCLEKLANNPDLRETLAHQGKLYADKMFSEETHFRKLDGFFKSLL